MVEKASGINETKEKRHPPEGMPEGGRYLDTEEITEKVRIFWLIYLDTAIEILMHPTEERLKCMGWMNALFENVKFISTAEEQEAEQRCN